jgi:error-prone DNA polymerase
MVHPYLRRREGKEPVLYHSPHPSKGKPDELKTIVEKTLGVPLFQEQAMRIAVDAAKFSAEEADHLRRAMATFRRVGTIEQFRAEFVKRLVDRGYPEEFAVNCFSQIEGFGDYGFPESHAASFALMVYASAWIKCHYPDAFAAALLNSQPMGFYSAAQLVRDAQEHGVEVREPDINHSDWDCTLEAKADAPIARLHSRHKSMRFDVRTSHALRLGLRQINGLKQTDAETIRRARPFASVRDLWLRTGIDATALKRLAEADAFRSLGLDRRDALWAVRALRRVADKDDLPLLARAALPPEETAVVLPAMTMGQQVVEDYRHLRLSLRTHPAALMRPALDRLRIHTNAEFLDLPDGARARIAGLVLVRQHPGSAKSIFMTLEDETAAANVMVWPKVFEAYRPIVMRSRFVAISGRVQSESNVIHLIAEELEDLTGLLRNLSADEVSRTEAVMPKGRNFH